MTQEELKRLAKIAPDRVLVADDQAAIAWRRSEIAPVFGASIVSSLLAPWTAVPRGDEEWVLTRFKDMGGINEHYPVWYSERVGDTGYMGATRFASPLHAAEALHGEKDND